MHNLLYMNEKKMEFHEVYESILNGNGDSINKKGKHECIHKSFSN